MKFVKKTIRNGRGGESLEGGEKDVGMIGWLVLSAQIARMSLQ